ncbi:MAG: hypothetical protein K8H88_17380 [Sandaracinaceae bacterium]|nr:hypothetical protein [Sandaracinaceae bacterium]
MDKRAAALLRAWFDRVIASGHCPGSELILVLARRPVRVGEGWRRHGLISPEGANAAQVAVWAIERFTKEVRRGGGGSFTLAAYTVAGRAVGELHVELAEDATWVRHEDLATLEPPDVQDGSFLLMREVLLRAFHGPVEA